MADLPSNHTWGHLLRDLQRMLQELPHNLPGDEPWWDLSTLDTYTLAHHLRQAEHPYLHTISGAIREYAQNTGGAASPSGRALFFLRLRIETSLQFVLQFMTCSSPFEGSLFEFPRHSSNSELVGFLLQDWWEAHGRDYAAVTMIAEYHDEKVQQSNPE